VGEIMRKTIWALPLATALAMATGIPSASATATGTVSAINRYSSVDDTQTSGVTPTQVGDCIMFANLRVSRPTSTGFTKVRFIFNTSTKHTNHSDQWHNSWKIKDFNDQTIGTVNNIDGVQMPTANVAYLGEIDTSISMTTAQWLQIAQVVWTGSC
jgi:hypothetical protein